MVIPFRRTIWSSSYFSGTVGDDALFVPVWTGHRAGVVGFRLAFWAMDDAYHGTVERLTAAQASHNGKDWSAVTLDPVPNASSGHGFSVAPPRHRLVNERHKAWVRIGLLVQRQSAPIGSAIQTIEGRLTLIREAV